jgi:hypothetical protein
MVLNFSIIENLSEIEVSSDAVCLDSEPPPESRDFPSQTVHLWVIT